MPGVSLDQHPLSGVARDSCRYSEPRSPVAYAYSMGSLVPRPSPPPVFEACKHVNNINA